MDYFDGEAGSTYQALFFSDIETIELVTGPRQDADDVQTILVTGNQTERGKPANVWLYDIQDADRVATEIRRLVETCERKRVESPAA